MQLQAELINQVGAMTTRTQAGLQAGRPTDTAYRKPWRLEHPLFWPICCPGWDYNGRRTHAPPPA